MKTAIRVLRKAGYHEQAMFLAEKHRVQSDYLRVLLEDLHQFNKALQYISTLDFAEVSGNRWCVYACVCVFPIRALLSLCNKNTHITKLIKAAKLYLS